MGSGGNRMLTEQQLIEAIRRADPARGPDQVPPRRTALELLAVAEETRAMAKPTLIDQPKPAPAARRR